MKKSVIGMLTGSALSIGLAVLLLGAPGCGSDPTVPETAATEAQMAPGTIEAAPTGVEIIDYEPHILYRGTDFGDAVARSTQNARGTSTVLWDATETEVLATLDWSLVDGTVRWEIPDVGEDVDSYSGFQVKLSGSDAALYYIYKNVQLALQSGRSGGPDPWTDEGCDYFPDFLETECILDCCAVHDACWEDHDCGLSSWIPFVGSSACKACNRAVVKCMAKCVLKSVGIGHHEQH